MDNAQTIEVCGYDAKKQQKPLLKLRAMMIAGSIGNIFENWLNFRMACMQCRAELLSAHARGVVRQMEDRPAARIDRE